MEKGPGFHGIQQCYRKKGEEQGKERFRTVTVFVAGMREGLQDNGHKEATANTSYSYSYDEMTSLIASYYYMEWRIYGCVRRFIARKAGFYPYFIPRRLRSGGRNELYSLSY